MSTPINDRDRDGIDDRREEHIVGRDTNSANDGRVVSDTDRTVANDTVVADTRRTDTDARHVDPDASIPSRQEVVEREKEQYGGIKFGSAFFGWLAATGMAVLLTALVAATGAALGLGVQQDVNAEAVQNAETIGIIGSVLLLVILFVAYYCGGYVAGRMARFNGAKQGLAVWLWALVIAIVVAVVGAIAGAQFNVLADLNTFPRIPINEGELTVAGIITAVVVALASLAGAVLGGMAGMRFHRKVDKAGLGA